MRTLIASWLRRVADRIEGALHRDVHFDHRRGGSSVGDGWIEVGPALPRMVSISQVHVQRRDARKESVDE